MSNLTPEQILAIAQVNTTSDKADIALDVSADEAWLSEIRGNLTSPLEKVILGELIPSVRASGVGPDLAEPLLLHVKNRAALQRRENAVLQDAIDYLVGECILIPGKHGEPGSPEYEAMARTMIDNGLAEMRRDTDGRQFNAPVNHELIRLRAQAQSSARALGWAMKYGTKPKTEDAVDGFAAAALGYDG